MSASGSKPPRAEDIAFAREIDGKSVPFHSPAGGTIGALQRAGLIRVVVVSRYVAETHAIGEAAQPA